MMKTLRHYLLAVAALLCFCNGAHAFNVSDGTDKVAATIISSVDKVDGEPFEILLRMEMKDGWHTYWKNAGEVGFPTEVIFSSENVKYVNQSFPIKFEFDGFMQYGYDNVAYYKYVVYPKVEGEQFEMAVKIRWLACREECAPESVVLNLELPFTKGKSVVTKLFEKENDIAEKTFPTSYQEKMFLEEASMSMWLIIVMAFAGGVLLNFMPCVFPILSIKAISLVQGSYSIKKARVEAMLYFCGVVLSFLIIAALLVWFRNRGESIGWGFQLQSPWFVSSMIVVFLFIFLMLWDVFSFGSFFANKVGRLSFGKKKLGSFMTGFFAVLVASPCTAPFMGIAIGYTLFKPVYVYYPVFLAMSVGYALPFTLIGLFPKALKNVLPRPGKWMVVLKRVFSVPILLTCVWLAWVLYAQIGKVSSNDMRWQEFEPMKVKKLINAKERVFINFTAKWCITCLANEAVAFDTDYFAALVDERNIHIFKADWTNHDEIIAEALREYGRNSIPLYVYCEYGDCVLLPQLITQSVLEEYIKNPPE